MKPHGLWAGACLTVDRQACLRADRVLVDTHAVGRRFVEDLKVPAERLVRVLQGQDDRVFRPGPGPAGSAGSSDASGSGRIEVLFAGTYVPLQGVDTILEAAARLQADPIQGQRIGFTLVGHGQMFRQRAIAPGPSGSRTCVLSRTGSLDPHWPRSCTGPTSAWASSAPRTRPTP